MATLDEQHYSTEYTGLVSTASLCLGFIGIMTISFETFNRLKRNVPRTKRPGSENEPPSIEDYNMAYLYRPRAFFGKNRGPQMPKWPLAWMWQVAKLPQSWYLRHSGLDSAVYVRFVTACWFFMLSQLLTTVVILLPLHIYYAPDSVLPSSIAQASVSSLIDSTTGGRKYLWVHTVLLWWQAICWISVLVYVGWGNIRMRREQILDPLHDAKDADRDEEGLQVSIEGIPPGLNPKGWRFRTCKVSNIPQHMRNEQALREYFDSCLSYLKKNPSTKFYEAALPSAPPTAVGTPTLGTEGNINGDNLREAASSMVDHVVIVRKLTELHELVQKRREVLHELESAHLALAREAVGAVASHVRLQAHQPSLKERLLRSEEKETQESLETLTLALGQYLPVDGKEYQIWQGLYNVEKRSLLPNKTIWEALADLDPKLLDVYQPVIKLKVFRGQVAPSIDYHLTKLNLLTSLIEDLRARPDSYAACDTAFVTFTKASDARLAKRELSWIRARGLTCRVRMAPDARDLDWNKLVQANFRGDVFRGFLVHALVWIATIIWIIPMGALVGLVSIDNLSTRIPALATWLDSHTKAKSLASTLIPTIIVTIVNMLVPTIMIQVSGRGQTFVTLSKLHHATWCRYWKWVIINVVIAFCAGTALFTSLLGIFTGNAIDIDNTADDRNPLSVIASSFSNGAVFFVSYTILITATQCFFELAQFMIPWFLFLGVRKASSPRQRFAKTEPRRFFAYTVSPNHTLVISVILVFSLLNPLPICFVFLYFSFAFFVFKDHFARLYWRVYYEGNGRLYYMRIMRYSLDALVLGEVVTMALFFVLKDARNGGACAALIPITVIVKLILTRWYDAHMNAADAAFADVVTGDRVVQREDEESLNQPDATDAGLRNRRAVNRRLSRLALPDLTIWETIKLPLKARSNLKTDKGPQGAIVRLAKRLQNSNAYTEIRESSAARREANLSAASDLAAPSAEKTLQALENPDARNENDAFRACSRNTIQRQALVVPHPRLQRDDRPDFSAPYIDPFLTEPLDKHLWLPRDPMYAIDLDDTIDWHGRALVSSEGGDGLIGSWNPASDDGSEGQEDDQFAHEIIVTSTPEPIEERSTSPAATPHSARQVRHSSASVSFVSNTGSPRKSPRPYGTERIRLATDIANRPDVEQSPATSLTVATKRSASSLLRASSPSDGRSPSPLEGEEDRARFVRSLSVGNVHRPYQPNRLQPRATSSPIDQPDLRRVQSEIVDPVERLQVRRETLDNPPQSAPAGRGRSHTAISGASASSGAISQSRALAHEVLQEQRSEAVARRRHEDKKMLSRMNNASKTWRSWFMKAPDDAD